MYAVADAIELQGDVPGAIEMLNEAGANACANKLNVMCSMQEVLTRSGS